MLHAAQLEAREKSDLMRNSQCRGEIGRLRSAAQNLSFRSPNPSFLDESDDFPTTKMATTMSKSLRGDRVLNESEHLDDSSARETNAEPANFGAVRYALDESNNVIRELHNVDDGEEIPAPIFEVPSKRASAKDSPGNKEQRTANVRTLDGENCETDWDALVPPLPGLQAWTNNSGLHQSLLAWMESI